MKKRRWTIPAALALAAGAIAAGNAFRYAGTYLFCGVVNSVSPFEGKCGDCVMVAETREIYVSSPEYCHGGPLKQGQLNAWWGVEPRSSFDKWIVDISDKRSFVIICPGPLCTERLEPEWSRSKKSLPSS